MWMLKYMDELVKGWDGKTPANSSKDGGGVEGRGGVKGSSVSEEKVNCIPRVAHI